MIDANQWMAELTEKLQKAFGNDLIFVGIQGSYGRGEAHEGSDIDAVVIFDKLTSDHLFRYKTIVAGMPESEKACGFVGDKGILWNWPRHELFQFAKDTRAIYGALDPLLPKIRRKDIQTSVNISASALYHESCHALIHSVSDTPRLKSLYKSAFFLLQALVYLRSRKYVRTKADLLLCLKGIELEILAIDMNWDAVLEEAKASPEEFFLKIIAWSGDILQGIKKDQIVTKESLFILLDALDAMDMRYWVEGGWGVDILYGKQTRCHRDLDISFDQAYTKQLLDQLKAMGYSCATDWLPVRAELYHPEYGYIDIHPVSIDPSGSARQANPEGGWFEFEADFFMESIFEGRKVPCISKRAQLLFHAGYPLRDIDKTDIKVLNSI